MSKNIWHGFFCLLPVTWLYLQNDFYQTLLAGELLQAKQFFNSEGGLFGIILRLIKFSAIFCLFNPKFKH